MTAGRHMLKMFDYKSFEMKGIVHGSEEIAAVQVEKFR
jgi:hypothetical protein